MGGATSRFADTAWDQVDGGLADASETLDGAPPNPLHTIITLKRPNIVNQRQFSIMNDLDEVIYTSKGVEGTTKDFDLYSGDNQWLFRIHATDSSHQSWMIFVPSKPVWEDQVADHSLQSGGEIFDQPPLFRKARVDIARDKHAGEVKLYGPSDDDNRGCIQTLDVDPAEDKLILKVEEIKSYTAQYQSYVPSAMPTPNLDAVVHPPLVGYWVWEHSPNRHQLKMHLAKGTDTALHCLLAIITNQVYVENQSNTEP
jgi:hypothetical protein